MLVHTLCKAAVLQRTQCTDVNLVLLGSEAASHLSPLFPYILPAHRFPGTCCSLINETHELRSCRRRPECCGSRQGGRGFILDLCGAIPAKSPELHSESLSWRHTVMAGLPSLSASRLNATLLSLLSALTTCLKLLNGSCLELRAPWRLRAY